MDLIALMRTFLAAAEASSFSAAAARRGLSPQLASKQVRALEDRLGVRLFDRTTRSVRLTEAGAAYRARAAALVEDLDALEASVRDEAGAPRGLLRISAPSNFGELHLAGPAASFAAAHEAVSIELTLTDRFVSLVEEGFDLAIRIGALEDSALIARRLAPVRAILCAAPDYLARRGRPERPDDLKAHDCVIDLNFRSGRAWPFLVDGARLAVRPPSRLAVNSAAAARRLALAGAGVALIPDYVIARDLAESRLTPLLTEFEALALAVFAVYPESRHLAPKVRGFVDHLATHWRSGFGPASNV